MKIWKNKIFNFYIVLLLFSIMALSFSPVYGQEEDNTEAVPEATISAEPAETPAETPSSKESDGKIFGMSKTLVIILAVVVILMISIAGLAIRIRSKLKEFDEHKAPIRGLASKSAGMIKPDKPSDKK